MEENYTEIDLSKIWESFKRVWFWCVIVCILSTGAAFLITNYLIVPKYKATGKIIVVQKNDAQNAQMNINDVNLSQKLVSTYSEILKSERISDLVVTELNLPYTNKEFVDMVSVSSANNTEVINVAFTSPNPQEAMDVANTTIKIFQEQIYEIMSIENVSVLNWAKFPYYPDSPSMIKNLAIGLLIGIMLSGLIVFIVLIKDSKVKTEDEFREILGYPILGVIPDFANELARLEKSYDKK
ncbi:YveK family protein [Anaerorhabdus sp.]